MCTIYKNSIKLIPEITGKLESLINNQKLQNMKSRFLFNASLALAAFSTITIASCKKNKDDQTPKGPKTIAGVVSSSPDFSILYAAVTKANLGSTLSGTGPFTVFAPDNDAFAASGLSTSTLASLSSDQVKSILLYHTVAGKIMAADVPAGPNASVTTAGGGNIYVTKNSKGVFVNGWMVKNADLSATNGVIHSIEHVLLPPAGDLVAVAQANSNLTYLVAAVLRASEGSTDVVAALKSAGPFTVFAPTNQAFIDAGFPTIASIQAADPNVLANILTYHVIAARAFSSDLSEGQTLSTLNGGTLKISLANGASVKGNSNTTASKITGVNIMATNGVVHVIDRVLLP